MFTEKLRQSVNYLILISLAVLAVFIWMQVFAGGGADLTAVVLDVGQGDSIFLRTPSGGTVLVDGGESGARVESLLRHEGVNRIDVLVLTHPHDDHLGGLVSVVKHFRVGMVLEPKVPCDTKVYKDFEAAVKERRIPHRWARRGQSIDFGDGVTARVLNPAGEVYKDLNDGSVVARFVFGSSSMVLMGDAGVRAEEDILASGLDVRSGVMKVAHHGSGTATSNGWLDAVSPRAAVISVGKNNKFGHPSDVVLRQLAKKGIRVFRTDRNGAVIIEMDGDDFTASGTVH